MSKGSCRIGSSSPSPGPQVPRSTIPRSPVPSLLAASSFACSRASTSLAAKLVGSMALQRMPVPHIGVPAGDGRHMDCLKNGRFDSWLLGYSWLLLCWFRFSWIWAIVDVFLWGFGDDVSVGRFRMIVLMVSHNSWGLEARKSIKIHSGTMYGKAKCQTPSNLGLMSARKFAP